MSALDTYKNALDAYTNAASDAVKASLGKEVKDAYDALSEDEKNTATPLPVELAAGGGRKSSRKSGGSRASKRGGSRANKRGGKRASKRGGSRANKRGGKRGGSRSSRR